MQALPRHQCMIYGGPPSHRLPDLAAAILHNLQAGARCLYLNSPPMVAGIRSYLAAAGVNVAREVETGALVLSSAQDHLLEGRFHVDRMLAMLADAEQQALRDGFTGLWASGDMTWEFGSERNFEKLLAYEYALEELFRKLPTLSGVCQYHVDTLPLAALQDALYMHQALFLNETLSRINPYYVPPGVMPKQRPIGSPEELSSILDRLRS